MSRTYSMVNQQGSVTLIFYPASARASQQAGLPTPTGPGNILTLPITPEDIVIVRPSRQAITQTLTSAYQDHLGSGISTVTMRGHTGWRNLTPEGDGYTIINRLRDLLGKYDKEVAQGRPDSVWLMLYLNLPAGWEQFRVSKNTATFSRSRTQPLLYRYEIQFTVLKDLNDATGQVDPSGNFVIQSAAFDPVQLVDPNDQPGVTGPGGGVVTTFTPGPGVSNAADQRAKEINWKLLKQNVSDQELTNIIGQGVVTVQGRKLTLGEEEPGLYATGNVGPEGQTLAKFANDQYDQNQYPGAMWAYIVAANPDIFRGAVDPNTFTLYPGQTLVVPNIKPDDAFSGRTRPADIAAAATTIRDYVKQNGSTSSLLNPARLVGVFAGGSGVQNGIAAGPGWDENDLYSYDGSR